ncbi:unnamed protein product, partial [Tilletia caries]
MSELNMHPHVPELLGDNSLTGASLGQDMIRAIDTQLKLRSKQDADHLKTIDAKDEYIALPITIPGDGDYQENARPPVSKDHQPTTLFAHAAVRVAIELGKASDDEAQAIVKRVPQVASAGFQTAVLGCVRLPYAILSQALRIASAAAAVQSTAQAKDTETASRSTATIDEWIIRNETYIRARLVLDQRSRASPVNEEESPSLSQLSIDKSSSHWKEFMVGLCRDAKSVFPSGSDAIGSSNSTIRIERPEKADLPGLLLLDHHRKDAIEINTLAAFRSRLSCLTSGALKGLDWCNVFVAGDLALQALTSTNDEDFKQPDGSDIDLYLWGLTVDQANAKLQDIEKIFVSNLPIDMDTGKPIKHAVLRILDSVTFVPDSYQHPRVRIVLKLFSNPMAILLNSDLDQFAIGYTGDEIWMLPRAARALVTGYTTFTMELIQKSTTASDSAAQNQELSSLLKSGKRGHGLRFLPAYLVTLPIVPLKEQTTTEQSVSEESLPRDELNVTLREERARVAWWLASRNHMFRRPLSGRRISLNDVKPRMGYTGDTAVHFSMSVWQLLARYIALWELAQLGYFVLDDDEDSWYEEY